MSLLDLFALHISFQYLDESSPGCLCDCAAQIWHVWPIGPFLMAKIALPPCSYPPAVAAVGSAGYESSCSQLEDEDDELDTSLLQDWPLGVLHDFRLVPGFEMVSLLFVALLHTDPYSAYELFFRKFDNKTPGTDPTLPPKPGAQEVRLTHRLTDPLSRFLAFVWDSPDDRGGWDDATVERILRPLLDRSDGLLNSLLERANRFWLARTVALEADDWAREIRERMSYDCPDDVATIFLLKGAKITRTADVLWGLGAPPGRPYVYDAAVRVKPERVQEFEPIWMIGSHRGVQTL
jgi:hypothetical protein